MTLPLTAETRPAPSDDDLLQRREGRWIDRWEPEDPQFWDAVGARTARRNLAFSILSEHIGFSVWVIWSVMVLFMPEPVWGFTVTDKFLLTTTPALLGSLVRLPYTFAVATFGGRNWTVVSAGLLLVPAVLALFVLEPGVPLGTLLAVTALAGVGGGNFASSMANINNFYPQRLKGRALGLNAGAGNLGVAAVQVVGALVLHAAGPTTDPRVMLYLYLPLVVLATVLAWTRMDNLSRRTQRQGRAARGRPPPAHGDHLLPLHRHVRQLHRLRLRLRSGARGRRGRAPDRLHLARRPRRLAGATAGRGAGRPLPGLDGHLLDLPGHDRRGRARAVGGAVGVHPAAGGVLHGPVLPDRPRQRLGVQDDPGRLPRRVPARRARTGDQDRRLASALVGIAGAVGAFGGVLVQLAIRESFLRRGDAEIAYVAFIGFYLVCAAVTWAVYLRPRAGRPAGV